MANGGDGHSDGTSTVLLSIFAFVSWFARFIIGRYFANKDKLEEDKRREKELKSIYRGIERRRKPRK